jgi:hypothetical protein
MRTTSFRFSRPYLEPRRYADHVKRDGLTMTFTSMHRPLRAYVSALARPSNDHGFWRPGRCRAMTRFPC